MSWVWEHSRASGTDLLVLLAIADSANDDGRNAWPSVPTIAGKCRVSERTVQRSLRKLVSLGELRVVEQAGGTESMRADKRPNRYDVLVSGASKRHPEPGGVTTEAERGDTDGGDGVSLVSPKPSIDPSIDPSSFVVSDDAPTGYSEDVVRLAALLADLMVENGCRRPSLTKSGWLDPIRLLIDKDGIEAERVEKAIRWCQADEFWRANIHSGKKLREKFDTLRQQAKRQVQARGGGASVEQIREAGQEYLGRRMAGGRDEARAG